MIQHDVNYPSWSRKPGKDYLREFIIVLFHINAVVPNLGLKWVKKEDTSSQSSNTILDLLPKHPPLLPCQVSNPGAALPTSSDLSIRPQHPKNAVYPHPSESQTSIRHFQEPVLGSFLSVTPHTRACLRLELTNKTSVKLPPFIQPDVHAFSNSGESGKLELSRARDNLKCRGMIEISDPQWPHEESVTWASDHMASDTLRRLGSAAWKHTWGKAVLWYSTFGGSGLHAFKSWWCKCVFLWRCTSRIALESAATSAACHQDNRARSLGSHVLVVT